MKAIYHLCGKISLLCYIFILYQLWHLCQFGGIRMHLAVLVPVGAVFLVSFVLWLVSRKYIGKGKKRSSLQTKFLWAEGLVASIATAYLIGRIIYAGIPYNGALSWELDQWRNQKEVVLEHDNFFTDGVEGVLDDLDGALDLPEDLYIVNQYQMTFDANGKIKSIYTFLYGQDKNGRTRTFLIDYDESRGRDMTVRINGNADTDFDEDKRLDPMLTILENASCEETVNAWAQAGMGDEFEILYMGKRSFDSLDGLEYLPGDVDGDGITFDDKAMKQMQAGGEIQGFEVSLHIPAAEYVTPVRYIMEPVYISRETLNQEQEQQQTESAKEAETWSVDNTDGTMYFFLNDDLGWRLVVADAAAGSRFYQMEKTENGGTSWEMANKDPFGGQIGVTEGLIFFDENFGFAGLTGASQSSSSLYMIRDGGETFTQVQLPMDSVSQIPEGGTKYGLTVNDYDYIGMPEEQDGALTVLVTTGAGEQDGILFQSSDQGATWAYEGVSQP